MTDKTSGLLFSPDGYADWLTGIRRLWKFQLSEIDEWERAGVADEDQGRKNGEAN